MALLELRQVTKYYPVPKSRLTGQRNWNMAKGASPKGTTGIYAVRGVSLTVEKGQSVGIIGESGAGKTTIAEMAAGLIEPTSGTVTIGGIDAKGSRNDLRRKRAGTAQIIWQDAPGSLDPRMRVEKILAEPLEIHGLKKRVDISREASRMLKEVGLPAEMSGRYPHELSGGQAQRVVIARALALNPKLLICDEPASALDARIKSRLADMLMELRKRRNLALMIIAHDLPLIRKLADEVLVMRDGIVIERGPVREILASPSHPYTKLLIDADPSSKWKRPVAERG